VKEEREFHSTDFTDQYKLRVCKCSAQFLFLNYS